MKDRRESLFLPLIFLTILSRILLLLALVALSGSQDSYYRVQRVVDGDTLLLTKGDRVRLIGVDTTGVHESKMPHTDGNEKTDR